MARPTKYTEARGEAIKKKPTILLIQPRWKKEALALINNQCESNGR
jgi:hypothetical protein